MPLKFLKWSSTTTDLSCFWPAMQSTFTFFSSFILSRDILYNVCNRLLRLCSRLHVSYLRIEQQQLCILQSRSESLKPCIGSGVYQSVKLDLQAETQESHFCVRPWSLLTVLNFFKRGPTDTTLFCVILFLVAETISFCFIQYTYVIGNFVFSKLYVFFPCVLSINLIGSSICISQLLIISFGRRREIPSILLGLQKNQYFVFSTFEDSLFAVNQSSITSSLFTTVKRCLMPL